jgi:hypothetical protein
VVNKGNQNVNVFEDILQEFLKRPENEDHFSSLNRYLFVELVSLFRLQNEASLTTMR